MAPTAAPTEQGASDEQLASIYGLYAPSLRRRCLQLTRDPVAAEDLVQEVFLRFLARVSPSADMNVHAYLLRMARNIWLNELRSERGHAVEEIGEAQIADDRLEYDPVRTLLLREQRTLVRRGAAGLADRQRRALTLRELEGHTYEEIGDDLGISSNAVAQVVWRARVQLRRALRRSQVDVERLPDSCRALLDDISDRLDSAAGHGTPELETHMADCRACRSTLASFQEAGARFRGGLPLVPLAALLGRAATALRVGAEAHLAAGAAIVTVAVVAVGGGGMVIRHAAQGSSPPRPPVLSAAGGRVAPATGPRLAASVKPVSFVVPTARVQRRPGAAAGRVSARAGRTKRASPRRRHAPLVVHSAVTPEAPRPVPAESSPPTAPSQRNPVSDEPHGPETKAEANAPVAAAAKPIAKVERKAEHEAVKLATASARLEKQAQKQMAKSEKHAKPDVAPSEATAVPATVPGDAAKPEKPVKAVKAEKPPAEQAPVATVPAEPGATAHGKKDAAVPPPTLAPPAEAVPVAADPPAAQPAAVVQEAPSTADTAPSDNGEHGKASPKA